MAQILQETALSESKARLAQAISEFETIIDEEYKIDFQTDFLCSITSPPTNQDVLEFIYHVDQTASSRGCRSRCFGPRFSNILHAVRQFTFLEAFVMYDSEARDAYGLWLAMKTCILYIAWHISELEHLSRLFMEVGLTAPHHNQLWELYPYSITLRVCTLDYMDIMARLCTKIVKTLKVAFIHSWPLPSSNMELAHYLPKLKLQGRTIQDKIESLIARPEPSKQLSGFDVRWIQRMAAKQLTMDTCSTVDYEKSWRRKRRMGRVNFYKTHAGYRGWRTGFQSCTLLIRGEPGSGKSVLLADIMTELTARTTAFFFCRHDLETDLTARVVVGSLVRQILQAVPDSVTDVFQVCPKDLSLSNLQDLLLKAVPKTQLTYFVLDGLDELPRVELEQVLIWLYQVQKRLKLKLCLSTRFEEKDDIMSSTLSASFHLCIPVDNALELERFIFEESQRLIDANILVVDNSDLVPDIKKRLLTDARGNFLWANLQLQKLCWMKTDDQIHRSLEDAPLSLSDLYDSILLALRATEDGIDPRRILGIAAAASRPLTVAEFHEAINVKPGKIAEKDTLSIKDVHRMVGSCGGLVVMDEEDTTIALTHRIIRQYIRTEQRNSQDKIDTLMADIVITYLGTVLFESKTTITQDHLNKNDFPNSAEQSKPPLQMDHEITQASSCRTDIGTLELVERIPNTSYRFLNYAKTNLLKHGCVYLGDTESKMANDFMQLLPMPSGSILSRKELKQFSLTANRIFKDHFTLPVPWDSVNGVGFLMYCSIQPQTVLRILYPDNCQDLLEQVDLPWLCIEDTHGQTALTWATCQGRPKLVRLILKSLAPNIKLCSVLKDALMTPLLAALDNENYDLASMILDAGYPINWAPISSRSILSKFNTKNPKHDQTITWLKARGAKETGGYGKLLIIDRLLSGRYDELDAIKHHIITSTKRNIHYQNLLTQCMKRRKYKAAAWLIQHGVKTDDLDERAQTVVQSLIHNLDVQGIRALIEAGLQRTPSQQIDEACAAIRRPPDSGDGETSARVGLVLDLVASWGLIEIKAWQDFDDD